jgi:hypothetical protein
MVYILAFANKVPVFCNMHARAHTRTYTHNQSKYRIVCDHLSVHPCTNYHRPSSVRIPLCVITMAEGLVQVDVCGVHSRLLGLFNQMCDDSGLYIDFNRQIPVNSPPHSVS